VKAKSLPYFENHTDDMVEWQFKCSQAILHNQQETVLIAISKKDYLEIDRILQQKNINANVVWLIDKEVQLMFHSHNSTNNFIPQNSHILCNMCHLFTVCIEKSCVTNIM